MHLLSLFILYAVVSKFFRTSCSLCVIRKTTDEDNFLRALFASLCIIIWYYVDRLLPERDEKLKNVSRFRACLTNTSHRLCRILIICHTSSIGAEQQAHSLIRGGPWGIPFMHFPRCESRRREAKIGEKFTLPLSIIIVPDTVVELD